MAKFQEQAGLCDPCYNGISIGKQTYFKSIDIKIGEISLNASDARASVDLEHYAIRLQQYEKCAWNYPPQPTEESIFTTIAHESLHLVLFKEIGEDSSFGLDRFCQHIRDAHQIYTTDLVNAWLMPNITEKVDLFA